MIPFWGQTYREYFVDLCLPSLLSPGNFPLLRAEDGHRLLIATTKADWAAIRSLPIIETMRRYVSPVLLEIDPPAPTPPGSVEAVMQQNHCQKLLVEAAYATRAYACMLWPDIIFSDGLVAALNRWTSQGYQLVMFVSLRHIQEAVISELQARNFLSAGTKNSLTARALTIPARVLADISVRHLHPEVCVYDIADARLPVLPAFLFRRVSGERGIIIHTFNGQPILMDFAAVERHDTECLSQEIFEYVYVDRNFSSAKVYFVQDSDEFGVLSLTPAAVGYLPNPVAARRTRLGAWFALLCRLPAAMIFHTDHNRRRLRRDLFRVPIRWHAQEIDEAWRKQESEFGAMIRAAVGNFYEADGPIATQLSFSLNPWRLPGYVFYHLYPLMPYVAVIKQALMGDASAFRKIIVGVRRRLAAAAPVSGKWG
jgi:hypothetical protein